MQDILIDERDITLESLIEHSTAVEWDDTAERVYYRFDREFPYDFAGVVNGGQLVGMVGRGALGFVLGARFGFALYARKPVREHMLPACTSFASGTPILEVLSVALTRDHDAFYDDVAVVDHAGRFLGLISVRSLVRVQSALMLGKRSQADQRREDLERKNALLFRSLNELKQSEGRFGILFENSALGVALLNPRGEIEVRNQRAGVLLGDAEIEESPRQFVERIAPSDRLDFLAMLRKLESGGVPGQGAGCEVHLCLPDHGLRLFRLFGSWIKETGQICLLLDDITDQRNLERRIAQEERSSLLETLAGGIAHEINNKLSPILGFTELLMGALAQHPDSANWLQYCRIIRDSATESSKIIAQLLQMSRPPAVERGRCGLEETVEGAVAVLRPKLREADVKVTTDFAPGPIGLLANSAQIKQVLINLLINAMHAMESGPERTIHITSRLAGDMVQLRIKDTGHGISPENMKRIFDPFFTTKGPLKGTGLGLSVSQTIIKQHGGDMMMESAPGEGTTVTLTLVRADFQPAADEKLIPFAQPADRPRRRVLVVDDEDYVTGLTQEILRMDMSCEVECASNGTKAVELLGQMEFDLVISDVRMDGMDGMALFQWISIHRPKLVHHFFFITGDAGGTEIDRKLEELGVPVLRKPFRLQDMVRTVARHLPSYAATEVA